MMIDFYKNYFNIIKLIKNPKKSSEFPLKTQNSKFGKLKINYNLKISKTLENLKKILVTSWKICRNSV